MPLGLRKNDAKVSEIERVQNPSVSRLPSNKGEKRFPFSKKNLIEIRKKKGSG